MTSIQALIAVTASAQELIAAIRGTTDQFDSEVARLQCACDQAEIIIQHAFREAAGVS